MDKQITMTKKLVSPISWVLPKGSHFTWAFTTTLRCRVEKKMATFQYSCLENPLDRGAWSATVYGVTESDMTE